MSSLNQLASSSSSPSIADVDEVAIGTGKCRTAFNYINIPFHLKVCEVYCSWLCNYWTLALPAPECKVQAQRLRIPRPSATAVSSGSSLASYGTGFSAARGLQRRGFKTRGIYRPINPQTLNLNNRVVLWIVAQALRISQRHAHSLHSTSFFLGHNQLYTYLYRILHRVYIYIHITPKRNYRMETVYEFAVFARVIIGYLI